MGSVSSKSSCAPSLSSCNYDAERRMTSKIEASMRVSQRASRKASIVKLLLLGSESSDTSHILRQIEYQHNISTANNMDEYIVAIRKFSVESIIKIYTKCNALYNYNPVNYKKFNLDFVSMDYIRLLQSATNKFDNNSWLKNKVSLHELTECIQYLWSLDAIQSCWELVFSSNAEMKHYLDKIEYIMDIDTYLPTYYDIMSMPYKNISEISLSFNKTQMNIVTMNGSKYSKKWLHSFDHITGIIFVVNLNDFDQYQIVDGQRVNALKHSRDLFKKIVNDEVFKYTPIMLIFDQYDLFKRKIENGGSITSVFPGYNDDESDIEKSMNYIRNSFMKRVENKQKRRGIYIHCTSYYGNNFNQIKQIFKDVQHIKLTKNLDIGGLL